MRPDVARTRGGGRPEEDGGQCDGPRFRSSFKDWARHGDVNELLLGVRPAHVEGSKTVATYARDDLLEKRRPVMQACSDLSVCPTDARCMAFKCVAQPRKPAMASVSMSD